MISFNNNNNLHFRLERNWTTIMFELITLVIVLATWAMLISAVIRANAALKLDPNDAEAFAVAGGSSAFFLFAIFSTLASLLLVVCSYFPQQLVNMPFKVSNIRQLHYLSRMSQVLAVTISLGFLILTRDMVGAFHSESNNHLTSAFYWLLVLVPIIYFGIKVFKARDME